MTAFSRRELLIATAALTASSASARDDPARGDLTVMHAALAARQISPAELIEAAIDRLERVNPRLNAVTARTYELARMSARRSRSGMPIVTKDNAPIAGQPWSQGSRAYRDRVATETQPYLAAALRAGFISIARSACPEFGLAPTTEAQLIGPTRNPWNRERSVGGSSGGSAALVAAGVVPVAHGNDGGGSLRIPAAACGVVGLKTTRHPTETDRSLSASGCLSRSVRDTALWTSLVGGLDLSRPKPGPLRIIATLAPPAGGRPDPAVAQTFEATLETLRALGHQVRHVDLPYEGAAFVESFLTLYELSALRNVMAFGQKFGRSPTTADLEPLTLGLAERGRASSEQVIADARATVAAQSERYRAAFAQTDVFVSPVLAEPPATIGRFAPTIPYGAQRADLIAYATYTFIQNASNTPAISLPMGWTMNGLPLGMQFAAAADEEATLVRLALELERKRPWGDRRPPVWAG